MQANPTEQYSLEKTCVLGATSSLTDSAALEGYNHDKRVHSEQEPTCFHGSFASRMEMYTNAASVAEYLDMHRAWFPRCAQPMLTEAIGENGYALTIGHFSSFGYEVEPKIGLDLLPQNHGIYRIQTIPVPNYTPPGYDVDFQAALQLIEVAPSSATKLALQRANAAIPECITHVEWELDLKVMIQFPRFIQALPKSLVQSTGDKLLNQIVRQVSRRLTQKVQEDFHTTMNITLPKKRKPLWQRGEMIVSED